MFSRYFAAKIKVLVHYRASLLLELLATGSYLFISLVFWEVVFLRVDTVGGLSKPAVYFYIILIEVFHTLYKTFFSSFSKTWRTIIDGTLDKYLILPRTPYYTLLCEGINPMALSGVVPIGFLLAYWVWVIGGDFDALALGAGVVFVTLGVFIFSLIQFTFSAFAFWVGRSAVLDELSDKLTAVQSVPHVVLPNIIKYALAVILPFALGPTNAALFYQDADIQSLGWAALTLTGSLALWLTIAWWIWTRGLNRYVSYGG